MNVSVQKPEAIKLNGIDVVFDDPPSPSDLYLVPPSIDLAETYRRVWSHPAYRNYAPGERNIDGMLAELSPRVGSSFIDFGCGTGRPAQELAKRGYRVLALDFADNCLDNMVDVPFLVADLTKLPGLSAQFGYCTDVMEHIEPERVDDVLAGIARCVRGAVYFAISTVKDAFGPALEHKQLHLTIERAAWWKSRLHSHWPIVDIVAESEIECHLVARKYPKGLLENAEGVVDTACNTPVHTVLEHVKANAHRSDVKWLLECQPHDRHAILVGGGPSLRHNLYEIKRRQDDPNSKQDIVALNGAAKFLLANGIVPDYLLMVDPRERNLEFLEGFPARAFLIGAQCHPKVFDYLAGKDATAFLVYLPEIDAQKYELLPKGTRCTLIEGPISAGLTAMSAMIAAGYRHLHLYGYDSSDEDMAPHAYPQQLSTAESKRLSVNRLGKDYSCSYAMFEQANTFPEFARKIIADFGATITVHGSGLLPDIAREMAANQGE